MLDPKDYEHMTREAPMPRAQKYTLTVNIPEQILERLARVWRWQTDDTEFEVRHIQPEDIICFLTDTLNYLERIRPSDAYPE
jgi:hypothetical protein